MRNKLSSLSDQQILSRAKGLAHAERRLQSDHIRVFAEIARRRLYLKAGFNSLFSYLVKQLGYSKACAYQRSEIAKASRQWPALLAMIEDRKLSLATATILAKHLTPKDGAQLLQMAAGKSQEEVEVLVARRTNTPVIRDSVRPVGVKAETPGAPKGAPRPVFGAPIPLVLPNAIAKNEPSEATRPDAPRSEDVIVKVSFATNKAVTDKLARAKDLLARKHPQGALSDIFETVLDEFLQRHDPQVKAERLETQKRFGPEPQKREKTVGCGPKVGAKRTRYIPAEVKREVYARDGGRCSYVSPSGRRCAGARYLEYDHVHPFALGGISDEVGNIALLCAEHNRERGRQTFGEWEKVKKFVVTT